MKAVIGVGAIATVIAYLLAGTASGAHALPRGASPRVRPIRVRVQPRVVNYKPALVSVSGVSGAAVSARIRGANDPNGLAYTWTAYRWRRLRLVRGRWQAALPTPPLRGVYQLQFRIQESSRILQSPHWLLRVMPPGTLKGPAFPTPLDVVNNYVSELPDNQVLVAARSWPQAAYDHRDPRMFRIFVIAYEPQTDNLPGDALGLFITTFRNGYHGRWRLLQATVAPPD